MNRTPLISTLLLLGVSTLAEAQTLNVYQGNTVYAFPAAQAGNMTYSQGKTLTIMGKTFALSDITRMTVDNTDVTDGTVSIAYDGDVATVTVAGNVAAYVTPTVTGAHVSIAQADNAGDDTSGEITYSLSGTSTDGSFTLSGNYKASVELCGLSLTSTSGAPLDIQDGKRIVLSAKKGTVNTLTDADSGSQKGCISCKGHLELKGKGTLNVYGRAAHGIYAKEYVQMKNCEVNILAAAKDGINCNQYFLLESGSLTIQDVLDDGIQVSYKDDTDRDDEDTGTATIQGGTLSIAVTAKAAKGIKAEGDVAIAGGELSITATGNGTWDSDNAKTKASACIGADGNVSISDGKLTLTASGSGGKGIGCDGTLSVSGGETTISTTGGMYAYVNGTEYTNYTGQADRLSTSQKSSPKGIRAEGDVTISGGTIQVSTTGNGAEGIESKSTLTITDGTINVSAYDDAINSSSHMYIKGGDITVVAADNDGLDANGNLYISGGTIRAFGTSAPECGIDANEEDGYSVFFTGGTLLAVGGGNSVPSSAASTQAYVSGSLSVAAGNEVTLKSGDTVLATFTVPETYTTKGGGGFMAGPGGGNRPGGGGGGFPGGGGSSSSSSVLVTCPSIVSGNSYTLSNGTSSTSVTAVLRGSNGGRP